jgi:hypothetical protein
MSCQLYGDRPRLVRTILITLVTLLFLFARDRLIPSLSFNLANVVLNRTLWQGNQTAIGRQRVLSLAAGLLEAGSGEKPGPFTETIVSGQCTLIPSMVIADYYRKQKDFVKASTWLRQAASADPYPATQDAILLPGWVRVTPRGDIALDWSSSNWHFRSDSQPANLEVDDDHGWLTISYQNNLEQRDRVIYEWRGPLQIPYWHTLQLRARVHPGAFLTFETHSTAGVQRYIHYHQGSGEWEEFIIALNAETLRYMYISLTEPSQDSSVMDYTVDIEPLTLVLGDVAGKCEP